MSEFPEVLRDAGNPRPEQTEPLHEVECPSCGATIRARMADAPEPKGQSLSWRHGYATGVLAARAGVTDPEVPDAR